MHIIVRVTDKFMLIVQRSFKSLLLDPLVKDVLANTFSLLCVIGNLLHYCALQCALRGQLIA